MMREGEVEPLEGVVIFSSQVAARNNVRILAQVSIRGGGVLSVRRQTFIGNPPDYCEDLFLPNTTTYKLERIPSLQCKENGKSPDHFKWSVQNCKENFVSFK